MDRREIERLLVAVRGARAHGQPAAMATVVRVRGSAYRREGTRMLIRQDGTYECSLSGGCLEPSVAEAAAKVIATGHPVIVNYDLADDSLWGLGMGCAGAIDVRIEQLDDDAVTRAWLDVLERAETAVLVTPLAGASGRLLVRSDGSTTGHLSEAAMEQVAIARARARLGDRLPHSGAEVVASGEAFFEVSLPAPELVIFGGGPDAAPLARHAWTLGFTVTVVDVRGAYLTREWFPTATRVLAHFDEFATAVPLRSGSFVLVMNHHVERDEESLRYALSSEAAYIGVLGPRARYEKLLSGLAAKGYRASAGDLARVHNPVGLAIGAETPEEVAVSVLGEVLAVRYGFEGGSLSHTSGSLHRPDASRLLTSS
jgi:xanthine dehydrogenase accessory factor